MFSAASVCLFVCQPITSKRVMMKLGGNCIVQKSRPSSNVGDIAPGCAPLRMWNWAIRRLKNQRRLSTYTIPQEMILKQETKCIATKAMQCVPAGSYVGYFVPYITIQTVSQKRRNIFRKFPKSCTLKFVTISCCRQGA